MFKSNKKRKTHLTTDHNRLRILMSQPTMFKNYLITYTPLLALAKKY